MVICSSSKFCSANWAFTIREVKSMYKKLHWMHNELFLPSLLKEGGQKGP